MEYASSDLIHEHEAILFSLRVLDEMTHRVESGEDVPAGDITALIGFLKLFADKCHHGKEEGIYFPALAEAGVPEHNGPIGVMLTEHEMGRGFIKQMQNSVNDSTIESVKFIRSSRGYINLLRAHIEKENKILFPMGDVKISDKKQKELLKEFEEFEENVIGIGRHEELHKQLEEFNRKYLKNREEKQ